MNRASRLTKRALIVAVGYVVALLTASVAHADPDPHMPNMAAGYCPGGGGGFTVYAGWCDGTPYPDGTHWHAVAYGLPMIGHPQGALAPAAPVCVIGDGPMPPLAPAGGCDGAAQ